MLIAHGDSEYGASSRIQTREAVKLKLTARHMELARIDRKRKRDADQEQFNRDLAQRTREEGERIDREWWCQNWHRFVKHYDRSSLSFVPTPIAGRSRVAKGAAISVVMPLELSRFAPSRYMPKEQSLKQHKWNLCEVAQ